MDTTRRSFFGLLGGVVAVATPAVAQAAPMGAPLRIDEWDEPTGVRRFHIETEDDVDIGVFFWISGRKKSGKLVPHAGDRVFVENPWQVFVPLVSPEEDSTQFGIEQRMVSVRRLAGEGKPVIHVTHLRKATGVEVVGVAALPRQVTVDDMRLLVPARLTS
jgi:hypothetical protein